MECHFALDALETVPACGSVIIEDPGREAPFLFTEDSARRSREEPITRIQLGRVVLLATEVGARFTRDGVPYDPAAWMIAPRRLFGGANAVEACRNEAPFLRAMVLHGLSYGLDADPEEIDALVDEDPAADDGPCGASSSGEVALITSEWRGPELYTATIAAETGGQACHVFQATIASGFLDVVKELKERVGDDLGRQADIRRGFDPSHPIVCANVSPAIGDLLQDVAADPTSSLADGLNIFIEHRFSS